MALNTIGHRLKVAAADAGMTQAQLAAAVGLSRDTVGSHMRGETEPTVSQLGAYARALGYRFTIEAAPATGLEPVTYRSTTEAVTA